MNSEFYPLDYIADAVAKHYGLTAKQVLGRSRIKHIAFARHVAIWFVRRHSEMSQAAIGKCFSDRDHTTVFNSFENIERRVKSDEKFAREMMLIDDDMGRGRMKITDAQTIDFNRLVIAVHGATNEAWKLLAAGESIREVAKILDVGKVADLARRVRELMETGTVQVAA